MTAKYVYIVTWYQAYWESFSICGAYTSYDVAAARARAVYAEPHHADRGVVVDRVPLDTDAEGARRVLHLDIDDRGDGDDDE